MIWVKIIAVSSSKAVASTKKQKKSYPQQKRFVLQTKIQNSKK